MKEKNQKFKGENKKVEWEKKNNVLVYNVIHALNYWINELQR